jgi:hypothetical protein
MSAKSNQNTANQSAFSIQIIPIEYILLKITIIVTIPNSHINRSVCPDILGDMGSDFNTADTEPRPKNIEQAPQNNRQHKKPDPRTFFLANTPRNRFWGKSFESTLPFIA